MSSDARARARARWEAATRRSLETTESVLEALEAIGAMQLAGEAMNPAPRDLFETLTVDDSVSIRTKAGDEVFTQRDLGRHLAPALELFEADTATFELVNLLDELEGSDDPESLRLRALDLLRWRDRAELVRLALEVLATPMEELDEPLSAFDDLLADRLWLFVPFNDERQLARDDPRRAHWWWQRGAHLSPSSALELFAVAELVETFPAAAAAFDRTRALVRNAARATARKTAVVSLRDWAARRSSTAGLSRSAASRARLAPHLRVAAATETPLWRSDVVELSFVTPDVLVIDLIDFLRHEALPHLEIESERIVATKVEGTVDRFTLRLPEDARGTLVLPLARGDLRISLPLDDDA